MELEVVVVEEEEEPSGRVSAKARQVCDREVSVERAERCHVMAYEE